MTLLTPQPKVKRYKCLCGKARMLCVIEPNGKPTKDETRLFKLGLEMDIITLEEARKSEMCFDCDLTNKNNP